MLDMANCVSVMTLCSASVSPTTTVAMPSMQEEALEKRHNVDPPLGSSTVLEQLEVDLSAHAGGVPHLRRVHLDVVSRHTGSCTLKTTRTA